MFVIIKHLDPSTTLDDLEEFVVPALNGRFFQRKGTLKAIKIIQLDTGRGQPIERHGIVRVNNDSIKKRIVKRLNGQSINDIKHTVAEYAIRHWSVDRRGNGSKYRSRRTETSDRRMFERRRTNLRMIEVGEKSFSIPTVRLPIPLAAKA